MANAGQRLAAIPVTQWAVELYRELVELNRDAYLPDLAMSVNTLAIRLAEAGRRAEALTAAQQAAELYRELARAEPELFAALASQAEDLVVALDEKASPRRWWRRRAGSRRNVSGTDPH